MKYLLAGIAALVLAAPAYANIVIEAGNNPPGGGTEENVQFENNVTVAPGGVITGDSTMTMTHLTFGTLSGQTLTTQGLGQASIECAGGCVNTNQLNSMDIKIQSATVTDFIGNLMTGTGDVDISAIDNNGQLFGPLKMGSNFFTILASAGETISEIKIVSDPGTPGSWTDFEQPRISGAMTTVPAPLIGHGLVALLAIGGVLFGSKFLERRNQRLA